MRRRSPRSTWTTRRSRASCVRLREESHNCWTSSCATDADRHAGEPSMAFANQVPVTPVDPALKISRALTPV